MRLMLGTTDRPDLLVEVDNDFNATDFVFNVVNGCWKGTFKNGDIRVNDFHDESIVKSGLTILTYNQDRLRGEYQDVFYNFNNIQYIAPKYKTISTNVDDIPF
jgi:hypothetical protein